MFAVVWTEHALDDLADVWVVVEPPTRDRIEAAVNWLNSELRRDPNDVGESRPNNRRIAFAGRWWSCFAWTKRPRPFASTTRGGTASKAHRCNSRSTRSTSSFTGQLRSPIATLAPLSINPRTFFSAATAVLCVFAPKCFAISP
jgi:hypothetical protein